MTEQESSSSEEQSSPPTTSDPETHVYKAIIAMGVVGDAETVPHFIALWLGKSEALAQLLAKRSDFDGKIQLLPLPEDPE